MFPKQLRYAYWLAALFLIGFLFLPLVGLVYDLVNARSAYAWLDWEVAVTAAVRVLLQSATQAALSAGLSLVVGLGVVWLLASRAMRYEKFLLGIITLPFLMPTVATGLALREVLGGFLNPGLALLLVGHVLANVAVVVRLVWPNWMALDQRIEWASAALGAPRTLQIRQIVLPLLFPTLFRSFAIVFGYCFSSMGLVLLLGGEQRTLETLLLRQVSLSLDFNAAAVTALLQFVVVGTVLFVAGKSGAQSLGFLPNRTRLRAKISTHLVASLIGCAFLFPTAWLLAKSLTSDGKLTLEWWRIVFFKQLPMQSTSIMSSLSVTVVTAATAALITATIATLAGASSLSGTGGKFWSNWLMIPLAVSSVTFGLALMLWFGRFSPPGLPAVVALPFVHALVALPLAIGLVVPQLQRVRTELLAVSQSLGANPVHSFTDVYRKALWRVFSQSAAVSVAVSIGEYGAASFLTNAESPTLTVLMMRLISKPGAEMVGSASVIGVVISVGAVLMLATLDRKQNV